MVKREKVPFALVSTNATRLLNCLLLATLQTSLIAQSFTVSTVFPTADTSNLVLNSPSATVLDTSGNMYISDTFGNVVVRRTPAGLLELVAGTGTGGFSGDGGLATAAQLSGPTGLAIDSNGNLLIADSFNQRIRQVTPAGIITTVAGNGSGGTIFPGQVATHSGIGLAESVVADASGSFYLPTTNAVVKVAPNGILSVLTTSGPSLPTIWPYSLALDNAGGIIVGTLNGIFRLNANSTMTTIATFTTSGYYFVAWNPSRGTCYGSSSQIKCVDGSGHASVLAGTGAVGLGGDGGPAASAMLGFVAGITFDSSGNLYICDGNKRVRIVDTAGIINTFWKTTALPAPMFPKYLATDSAGTLYISDEGANVVFRVTPAGVTSVVAGTGVRGVGGDGVAATDSSLFAPTGIHVDSSGNLYIAEDGSHRVRKVDTAGIIHTIAGTRVPGFSGDGGPGQAAMLNTPFDVTTDSAGNVYIADAYNNRVRRVAPDGVITTVAGSGPASGFASSGSSGDGGPAVAAQLNGPIWLGISPAGDIYVADSGTIRKFRPGGNITTVLGTGACGVQGDGGLATLADICGGGFAADSSGNLFVAGYNQVHMLDSTGHVTT
jgi:sugar lactone lactonase YvrE